MGRVTHRLQNRDIPFITLKQIAAAQLVARNRQERIIRANDTHDQKASCVVRDQLK